MGGGQASVGAGPAAGSASAGVAARTAPCQHASSGVPFQGLPQTWLQVLSRARASPARRPCGQSREGRGRVCEQPWGRRAAAGHGQRVQLRWRVRMQQHSAPPLEHASGLACLDGDVARLQGARQSKSRWVAHATASLAEAVQIAGSCVAAAVACAFAFGQAGVAGAPVRCRPGWLQAWHPPTPTSSTNVASAAGGAAAFAAGFFAFFTPPALVAPAAFLSFGDMAGCSARAAVARGRSCRRGGACTVARQAQRTASRIALDIGWPAKGSCCSGRPRCAGRRGGSRRGDRAAHQGSIS